MKHTVTITITSETADSDTATLAFAFDPPLRKGQTRTTVEIYAAIAYEAFTGAAESVSQLKFIKEPFIKEPM